MLLALYQNVELAALTNAMLAWQMLPWSVQLGFAHWLSFMASKKTHSAEPWITMFELPDMCIPQAR